MLLRLLLLSCLASLVEPGVARAWTEAHVREAHVKLSLRDDARADVVLELTVEVRGGWLERLELPGLDEGLALAPVEPALAVLESGEHVPAQVVARASVLTLKFTRRDGLKRGVHRVRVHYSAPLAARAALADGGARLAWTLPGWEAGLTSASIEIAGPKGLRAVLDADLAVESSEVETGSGRVLRYVRLHVPRASPWMVSVDAPGDLLAGAPLVAPRAHVEEPRGRRYTTGLVLAALALLLMLGARAHVDAALALGTGSVPGSAAGFPALAGLALAGAACWVLALPLALICWSLLPALGIRRGTGPEASLALGGFAPLSAEQLRRLARARRRQRVGVPWADVTTLLGALGALGFVLAVCSQEGALDLSGEPWGLGALPCLFSWVFSAGSLRARSLAEQVALLLRAARRTRAVGCALGLVAYAARDRLEQPRLRIFPSSRYPGLLRLDVLVDTRRGARPLLLSVLVEADSPVERWVCARWPALLRERSPGGPRIALLRPIDDVGCAVEELLEYLSGESQRLVDEAARPANAA